METLTAYLISIGIIACGIWIVAGTIAAGSALPWTLAGAAPAAIGVFSLIEQIQLKFQATRAV